MNRAPTVLRIVRCFTPNNEKTVGMAVARHGDLFRRATALSVVDFRAYLLVD